MTERKIGPSFPCRRNCESRSRRLCRMVSAGTPCTDMPNKTLACRQSRRPLRRTWAAPHLHTSGIARGWSLQSIYSRYCFWLVVTLPASGVLIYNSIPRISFHHLSVFHPLEIRRKDRRSPGRTDTPSTRIPHSATLRRVKVSGPRWATCHTIRESHEALSHVKLVSSIQPSSRVMEMIVDH